LTTNKFKSWLFSLRSLVEVYYDVQDVRIRTANRLRQFGKIKGVDHPRQLKKIELEIRKDILEKFAEFDLPIWTEWLSKVKGIGSILGAGLIGYIGDISRFDSISKLWAYSGLHVVDGRAPKRKRGEKINWNPKMRALMWKIARSFAFQKEAPSRTKYEENKRYYLEKYGDRIKNPKSCPEYEKCRKRLKKRKEPACKGHLEAMARRRLVKQFLACLWLKWRELEGLPVSKPYAIEHLGHKSFIEPDDWILVEEPLQN